MRLIFLTKYSFIVQSLSFTDVAGCRHFCERWLYQFASLQRCRYEMRKTKTRNDEQTSKNMRHSVRALAIFRIFCWYANPGQKITLCFRVGTFHPSLLFESPIPRCAILRLPGRSFISIDAITVWRCVVFVWHTGHYTKVKQMLDNVINEAT